MINNTLRKRKKEFNMMKFLKYLSYILVLIGALNWGLYGIFGLDLVAFLFGEMTLLSRIVYILVGVSAILAVIMAYMNYNPDNNEV